MRIQKENERDESERMECKKGRKREGKEEDEATRESEQEDNEWGKRKNFPSFRLRPAVRLCVRKEQKGKKGCSIIFPFSSSCS